VSGKVEALGIAPTASRHDEIIEEAIGDLGPASGVRISLARTLTLKIGDKGIERAPAAPSSAACRQYPGDGVGACVSTASQLPATAPIRNLPLGAMFQALEQVAGAQKANRDSSPGSCLQCDLPAANSGR